ncbi:hypothetical protein BZA05DRAFT_416067 [Tricharina praecox]|uniref:uncharacterized protein n=1 Tax=Tricharina praecox TaxID=43433 RepID=UPI00221F5760|nr:uncharacterized protein BZA05DRAFT_416067 [Tricharina praecox]KAI5856379.1 hypothetical protein BZA05DRAFT_416067 [Tricharina praecox]
MVRISQLKPQRRPATPKAVDVHGTPTDLGQTPKRPASAILSDNSEFGQLTPGNSQKWDATEGTRGTFTFTRGDEIVALAKANGQLVRGQADKNKVLMGIHQGAYDVECTAIAQALQADVHRQHTLGPWQTLDQLATDDVGNVNHNQVSFAKEHKMALLENIAPTANDSFFTDESGKRSQVLLLQQHAYDCGSNKLRRANEVQEWHTYVFLEALIKKEVVEKAGAELGNWEERGWEKLRAF